MKKLTKINLLNLSQTEMAKRQESMLKGGYYLPCVCVYGCACRYAGDKEGPDDSFYGGSSHQNVNDNKTLPTDNGNSLTYAPR
ncbi:hypothetical protein B5F34_08345 [Mediterranea sp. An20]|uniref:TIGR04149 family rSAM-modified RiPP n=1 Tax=Mediterranea sp. An20 TaxID=1965586 RepID=UPI000B3882E1|nr:TIGR04149 family rSAM-modified RiPP [Mediterranea sp. An20]OUP08859.1 hypothetical protein B5F34_08345 [Mediterranea sp. An20]